MDEAQTCYNYYMIFCKDAQGSGHFQFIVENETIADQFCSDFPDHFYMSRDEFQRFLQELASKKVTEEPQEAAPNEGTNSE